MENIYLKKLLFGSPAYFITLFFAIQLTAATTIFLNNSSELGTSDNQATTKSENFTPFCGSSSADVVVFSDEFRNEIERVKADVDTLVIALTKTNTAKRSKRNATGNFTRPDSSNKMTRLENQIAKLKEDVAKIKNNLNLSSEDEIRLATLEASIETLQRLLDNFARDSQQSVESLEKLVADLVAKINELTEELARIKSAAEERMRVQQQRDLPNDCIVAIRSHDFVTAKKKLEEINDDSKINLIVNQVYNYQVANFDLLLEFADNLGSDMQSIKRSFLIYKALAYEIETNGHNYSAKIKKLIDSLESKVINQPSPLGDLKNQAYSLLGNVTGGLPKEEIGSNANKTFINLVAAKSFVETVEKRGIHADTLVDSDGDNILFNALFHGLDVVKYLIEEKDFDVNIKNQYNSTPLHYAALSGHLDVVRYLVEEKYSDIHAKNIGGYTPLEFASLKGDSEVVAFLRRKIFV